MRETSASEPSPPGSRPRLHSWPAQWSDMTVMASPRVEIFRAQRNRVLSRL